MKKLIATIMVLVLATNFCSAQRKKSKTNMAGEYSYETECLGVEGDGSQTLKSYGFGNSRNDAIEQAKKNAVRDVLFKGITKGKEGCNVKPLLPEVNVQEKNEEYFNKFFTDDGPYKEFISMNDEPVAIVTHSTDRKKADNGVTYGLVVQVRRAELKKKMIFEHILPQQ